MPDVFTVFLNKDDDDDDDDDDGGGGVGEFLGDHFIFRRTEGGSVVTESPKEGGSLKILEGLGGGGPLKSAWTMPDMGGIMKVIISYEGGSLQ